MTKRRFLPTSLSVRLIAAVSFGALLAACAGDLPAGFGDEEPGEGGSGPGTTTSSSTTGGGGEGGTGSGGEGGGAVQQATYAIAVNVPTPDMELRTEQDVDVTITPNGFVGPVTLAVSGLSPDDMTGTFDTTTVNLDGSTTVMATLTLKTLSISTAGPQSGMVTATSEAGVKEAPVSITIIPQITITIPPNVATKLNTTDSFGAFPTVIKALPNLSAQNPIRVRFYNSDGVPREIHADNPNQGFAHTGAAIQPGQFDAQERNVNAAGTYSFYMHGVNQGTTIQGQIKVE
ncbi:hypothetical protein [Chondromyces apiculatus]|uniref:Uncharacterized protein n=1 Tax=Chondromyces apiculatus DSM 436 TaxID=1192034 RepID=A0A017TDU4_9BACT|nr:hypothetical protein [Chondromyces apiculatus]EYF07468.1 Hypothetical protein CAP_0221 [Chondromyces apiculatus DSM 436]